MKFTGKAGATRPDQHEESPRNMAIGQVRCLDIYIYSTWAIMCDLIVPDMVLVRHQLICCSSCNSGSSCNVHDAAV